MCSEIYFSASPLYMFRAAHTPIIRSTLVRARLRCEEVTETIWDRLWIVPMASDTVKIVLLMMGVCAARNM